MQIHPEEKPHVVLLIVIVVIIALFLLSNPPSINAGLVGGKSVSLSTGIDGGPILIPKNFCGCQRPETSGGFGQVGMADIIKDGCHITIAGNCEGSCDYSVAINGGGSEVWGGFPCGVVI